MLRDVPGHVLTPSRTRPAVRQGPRVSLRISTRTSTTQRYSALSRPKLSTDHLCSVGPTPRRAVSGPVASLPRAYWGIGQATSGGSGRCAPTASTMMRPQGRKWAASPPSAPKGCQLQSASRQWVHRRDSRGGRGDVGGHRGMRGGFGVAGRQGLSEKAGGLGPGRFEGPPRVLRLGPVAGANCVGYVLANTPFPLFLSRRVLCASYGSEGCDRRDVSRCHDTRLLWPCSPPLCP